MVEPLVVRPGHEVVIAQGKAVLQIRATRESAEKWVKDLGRIAKTKVDWHLEGKNMMVRHFGDAESRIRLEVAIEQTSGSFVGQILDRYKPTVKDLFDANTSASPTV